MMLNWIISTALKKAFSAEKSIQKMAKEDFIMLNLVVSEHPWIYQHECDIKAVQWIFSIMHC